MTRLSMSPAALGCVVILSGCNTHGIVPEPGKITLQEAMKSVGEGLTEMHASLGGMKTGLMPSEVEVTFNISASATDTGKLYVEVGAPAGAPVTGKAGGESGTTTTAARGNQISIKFLNVLFAGDKTLVSKKSAEELAKTIKAIEQSGWQVFLAPDPP